MAKKNNIEHAMQAYWRSVEPAIKNRVCQAFLAGVKYGLTCTRTGEDEVPDAKD